MTHRNPFQISITLRPVHAQASRQALRSVIDRFPADTYSGYLHNQLAKKLLAMFNWVAVNEEPKTMCFAYGNAVVAMNILWEGVYDLRTMGRENEGLVAEARAAAEYFEQRVY